MEILTFKTPQKFRKWLEKYNSQEEGIWLRFFNKSSGIKSMTYEEALDEALCFGWIDGQLKKDAPQSHLIRFTHRRKGSIWSKRNTQKVEQLIKDGRMTIAGLNEINQAKKDGRWELAYGSQVDFEMPKDFILELNKNKTAKQNFEKLSKSKKYTIYWKLNTLKKKENREEWKQKFIQLLSNNKTIT